MLELRDLVGTYLVIKLTSFDYSICDSVYAETLDTGRTYITPDGNFPSVTTILGKTANNVWLDRWKERVGEEEARRVSKLATDRGELIHKYLERYWNRDNSCLFDLEKETLEVRHMTNNLIKATQQGVTNVWIQELPLWSKSLGFAGRVDMIGEWLGVPSVIDFKTSKKKKQAKDIRDYFLQCAAYAIAHNEMFGSNIKNVVVLITVENSEVQEFKQLATPFIPMLKSRILEYKKLCY